MPSIVKAHNEMQFNDAAKLLRAYSDYIIAQGFGDCIMGNIDREVSDPDRFFPADRGGIYILYWDDEAAGCVALEQQKPRIGEIRRLYVSRAYRGKGLGKMLTAHALEQAVEHGYHTVRLDTFRSAEFAAGIYRELGFNEVPPFNKLPPDRVLFMERTI